MQTLDVVCKPGKQRLTTTNVDVADVVVLDSDGEIEGVEEVTVVPQKRRKKGRMLL